MLRQLVLDEHLAPPRYLHPWLLAVLAGWFMTWHGMIGMLVETRNSGWAFQVPIRAAWMLGALALVGIVWAVLVQLRRVDPRDGVGFLLSGFGVWVIQWVDMLAMLMVELPPHYLSRSQFGETQAALCSGAGYVAYAVGLGLVLAGVLTGWRRGGGRFDVPDAAPHR